MSERMEKILPVLTDDEICEAYWNDDGSGNNGLRRVEAAVLAKLPATPQAPVEVEARLREIAARLCAECDANGIMPSVLDCGCVVQGGACEHRSVTPEVRAAYQLGMVALR